MNPTSFYVFVALYALLAGVGMCISLYTDNAYETGKKYVEKGRPKYSPALYYYIPAMTFVMVLLLLLFSNSKKADQAVIDLSLSVLLYICVYYSLLLLCLPLLRKFLTSRTCAALWAIPYVLIYVMFRHSDGANPVFVLHIPIPLPESLPSFLFYIWLAGFCAVLGWNILTHLRFRKSLLSDAKWCDDSQIKTVWLREQLNANIYKEYFDLYISHRVRTPLSIGLLFRTTCVILPEREYTEEELELILRHELVHIGRRDSANKLFIVFCTAALWFNPIMWIAMRRYADDIELSCDETVLLGCSDETRHRYASLLLNTAGDQRGFTTCLSASASSLRYRLKNVVAPRKRYIGGVLLGLITALLVLSYFFVAVSYNRGIAAERIFSSSDPQAYRFTKIYTASNNEYTEYQSTDEPAVMEYLLSLSVSKLMQNGSLYGTTRSQQYIAIRIEGPSGPYWLDINPNFIQVRTYSGETSIDTFYHLETPLDWEYLLSLLQEKSY